jgi:hypothetical protein
LVGAPAGCARLADDPARKCTRRYDIPTVVGDVGRRLLESVALDSRSFVLAVIVGSALLGILLMREIELIRHPGSEHEVQRLDGAIVGLCIAVGTIVLARALAILL